MFTRSLMLASMTTHDSIHGEGLALARLRQEAPAIFAQQAAAHTSPTYRFIRTAEVVEALLQADFVATHVRQSGTRELARVDVARHLIRFRHRRESVTLRDAIPEVVLINAHDGTATYQLRLGLFRPICTNGLLTRLGDFGLIRIAHRSSVVADVVEGALQLTRRFADLGGVLERMAARQLEMPERLEFARAALEIRYPDRAQLPFPAERLLEARRREDELPTLWHTYNVVQERLMRGGIDYSSARGRRVHTRAVRAIREDVRVNSALWALAEHTLEGEAPAEEGRAVLAS